MNAPSPWLLPLRVLAVLLGVANAVLLGVWLQRDPPIAPASANERSPAGAASASAAPVAGELAAAPTPSATPAPPPGSLAPNAAGAAPTAVLYGTVTSDGGAPITDGVFWLYAGSKHAGTESLRTGTFAFAGLAPGHYRLASRIPDELPFEREVDVVAPTTRLDIELPARWLLRVDAVTPAGEPLKPPRGTRMNSGIAAAAFAEPPSDQPLSNHSTVTAGLGTFRANDLFRMRGAAALPKQTVGVLALPADQPLHVALMLRGHVVAVQPAQPGQEVLTFTLADEALQQHLAKARIRCVDADGKPVAGARVALNDAQTGGGGEPTGEDGRVELTGIVPGRLDLEVWGKDLHAPMQQVDVPPGADLDLGDVVLRPGVRVEFELANFEGKGAVRFNMLDPLGPGRSSDDGYLSRDNGSRFPMDLYPGRYGFLASAENGVAIVELDLQTAPPGPVRFDLRPGAELTIDSRVSGTVVHCELRTQGGTIVRRRELTTRSQEAIRLPPGAYVLTTTDAAGKVVRRDVQLPANGATVTVP